jgi:importin-5
MYPMLNTLPSLPHSRLPKFLSTLNPLCISNPNLFAPHLPALLAFLPAFILPPVDPGPTPTISKPFPIHEGAFSFPPIVSSDPKGKVVEERDEETEEVRKAALELMVSLSEARPVMAKRVEGWIPTIVKGCLEGMAELDENSTDLWLEADVNMFRFQAPVLRVLMLLSSLQMILQMMTTRTTMSSLLIASHARVVGKLCYLLHSSKFQQC